MVCLYGIHGVYVLDSFVLSAFQDNPGGVYLWELQLGRDHYLHYMCGWPCSMFYMGSARRVDFRVFISMSLPVLVPCQCASTNVAPFICSTGSYSLASATTCIAWYRNDV